MARASSPCLDDFDRKNPRRAQKPRGGQLLSTLDLGVMDASEVNCGARARADLIDRQVMTMQAANPHGSTSWLPLELVANRHCSRRDGSRHDRPMPLHRERPVDRHPKHPLIAARRHTRTDGIKRRFEFRDPLTGRCRCPHDCRIFENRPADERLTSSSTRSSQDGSARSHLVSTITPPARPRRWRISRCSRV